MSVRRYRFNVCNGVSFGQFVYLASFAASFEFLRQLYRSSFLLDPQIFRASHIEVQVRSHIVLALAVVVEHIHCA